MRKAITPKKLVRYFVFFCVGWISYRIYISLTGSSSTAGGHSNPFGPRDLSQGGGGGPGGPGAPGLGPGPSQSRNGPLDLDIQLQKQQSNAEKDKQRQPLKVEPRDVKRDIEYKQAVRHNARDFVYDVAKDDDDDDDYAFDEGEREREGRGRGGRGGERGGGVMRNDNKFRLGEDGNFHPDDGKFESRDEFGDEENEQIAEHRRRWGERGEGGGGGGGKDDTNLRFNPNQGKQQPERSQKGIKKDAAFKVEHQIDWVLEEELQKRRRNFLAEVEKRAEEYDPATFKDMHEKDDHLAFVTAADNRTSFLGLLQFVYSVQYFYPNSDIGIYDLGLAQERREKLQTYCRVSVIPTYMKFWPEYLADLKKQLWRPLIWQMALAHYGHMVYVEPERYISKKNMKEYILHSRRRGITIVGKKLQYSPFVVTHPEMYFFFSVDTRKLQRVPMFEPTMVIMHNAEPVRHEFMRFLVSCSLEEYCISPPGSQQQCDQRFYPGSKKYANCHRYELSAINILMYRWFGYKTDDFLVKDVATAHYTGQDVTSRLKTCAKRDEV